MHGMCPYLEMDFATIFIPFWYSKLICKVKYKICKVKYEVWKVKYHLA